MFPTVWKKGRPGAGQKKGHFWRVNHVPKGHFHLHSIFKHGLDKGLYSFLYVRVACSSEDDFLDNKNTRGMDMNRGLMLGAPRLWAGPLSFERKCLFHNVKITFMAVWAPRPKKLSVHPWYLFYAEKVKFDYDVKIRAGGGSFKGAGSIRAGWHSPLL